MVIAGIDPSLSNFGLAKGTYDGAFTLSDVYLVQSQADNKNKKTVRKNSDDLNRANVLSTHTRDFLRDVDLAFVEVPVGSQSARSMASYGICIGILAGLTTPLIQLTPTEVKVAATGKKTASKQDMIDWATAQYPFAPWLTRTVKGQTMFTAKNEHLADAVGAIHAGLQTDQFKQLMAIRNAFA